MCDMCLGETLHVSLIKQDVDRVELISECRIERALRLPPRHHGGQLCVLALSGSRGCREECRKGSMAHWAKTDERKEDANIEPSLDESRSGAH